MLSVGHPQSHSDESRYAECHYAKCRGSPIMRLFELSCFTHPFYGENKDRGSMRER